jgi:hypothetical protein
VPKDPEAARLDLLELFVDFVGSSPSMSPIRWFTAAARPSTHLAYRLSITSTLLPARSATSVGSTPEFSQVDSAAWRRSYGLAAIGDAAWSGVRASRRISVHTRK